MYAMEDEAAPTLKLLNIADSQPTPLRPHLPALKYTGRMSVGVDTLDITVVVLGKQRMRSGTVDRVGTVSAALATYAVMQASPPPQLIINAGTGGGFSKIETTGGTAAAIGDVFLVNAFAYHDRRIPFGPAYMEYGEDRHTARFDVSDVLGKLLELQPQLVTWKTGVCSTGNSLDFIEADRERLAANHASVKEMEAAAIAEVAAMYHTPFAAVKAITDIVDGTKATGEEFGQNLQLASSRLALAMSQFLFQVPAVLAGRTEHETEVEGTAVLIASG